MKHSPKGQGHSMQRKSIHSCINQTFNERQHYARHVTPLTARVPAFLKLKAMQSRDMHLGINKQVRLKSQVFGEKMRLKS